MLLNERPALDCSMMPSLRSGSHWLAASEGGR